MDKSGKVGGLGAAVEKVADRLSPNGRVDEEDLRVQVAELRDRLDTLARSAAGAAAARGHEVAEQVRGSVRAVREGAEDTYHRARDGVHHGAEMTAEQARHQAECVRRGVRDHPLTMLAGALALGFVVGLIKSPRH